MRDRVRPSALTDGELDAALVDLGGALAVPGEVERGSKPDPAAGARARIVAGDVPSGGIPGGVPAILGRLLRPRRPRPLRGPLALAAIAILAIAALAGAVGFGLPGIRIIQTQSQEPTGAAASTTPSPSIGPLATGSASAPASAPATVAPSGGGLVGGDLGLGDPIAVAAIGRAVDFPIVLPAAPGIGAPDSAWLLDRRLTLVWAARPSLPATADPGIGLVLSEFRGSVDTTLFQKILGPDTTIVPVTVAGVTGYWISGAPHVIVFIDANGQPVFDTRRIVGDTLLWARGDVTYRLETSLGEAPAVALAESLR